MSNEKISVIARIKAKSGQESAVREALKGLVSPSRKESGNQHYELFEEKHKKGSFFTYEEWESEAALQKHMDGIKDIVASAMALFDEPPIITVVEHIGD